VVKSYSQIIERSKKEKMGKKGMMYNLVVGLKVGVLGLVSSAVMIVPAFLLLGLSFATVMSGEIGLIGGTGMLGLLLIPLAWMVNGWLINKYKSWIFR